MTDRMDTCSTCRHFFAKQGQRRRNAPVVTGGMHCPVETVFPQVSSADWCGEYELVERRD